MNDKINLAGYTELKAFCGQVNYFPKASYTVKEVSIEEFMSAVKKQNKRRKSQHK